MAKKQDEIIDLENTDISYLHDMRIAYRENEFMLAFNKNGESFEKAFVLPANRLQKLIMVMFQAGVQFQKATNVDIGFGMGEEKDESAGEDQSN